MIMLNIRTAFLLYLVILWAAPSAHADNVNLKNGGVVAGIIEKENSNIVELNTGFGTITFSMSQVKNIERSGPEESRKIEDKWAQKKISLRAREKEFEEERGRRSRDAYMSWMEEERQKRSSEYGSAKQINISRDQGGKGIMVEVLLNDSVKASLVLDTGASIVALSRRVGESLGVDLSDTKKDVMEMRLADGSRTLVKTVLLDSVKIQDVEVRSVMAAIMLEQVPGPGSADGLLGMSFLSKFNLKTDLKSMKMSLEKIE